MQTLKLCMKHPVLLMNESARAQMLHGSVNIIIIMGLNVHIVLYSMCLWYLWVCDSVQKHNLSLRERIHFISILFVEKLWCGRHIFKRRKLWLTLYLNCGTFVFNGSRVVPIDDTIILLFPMTIVGCLQYMFQIKIT